jgi:hypothetical protein|tara:strand:- start:960 stop:1310 length:351 start_codon:yes stop_codon:yes gene_type:complete
MTAEIFNFSVERAKRKSGFNDTALLEDMVAEGYDPCDPIEIQNYYQWKNFQNVIYDDIDIGHNWTEEALDRLFTDIKNMDPTQNITYTVDISDTDLKDLVIETDKNFDFSHLLPKK